MIVSAKEVILAAVTLETVRILIPVHQDVIMREDRNAIKALNDASVLKDF
jgi:hypothetical protein